MVKLKRLKILRYRDVEPCELRFSDRFNVLLGPNGAGKTTLLDLISKVLSTNLGDSGDPFSIEVELVFPGGVLAGRIETAGETRTAQMDLPPDVQMAFEARPGAPRATHLPNFDLKWTASDPASIVWIRTSGEAVLISRDGDPRELKHPSTALDLIVRHGLVASLTVLASVFNRKPSIQGIEYRNASRFDESLDTFRAITARKGDLSIVQAALRPVIEGSRRLDQAKREAGLQVAFPIEGMVPPAMVDVVKSRFVNGATDVLYQQDELHFLSDATRLLDLRSAIAKLEFTGKAVVPPMDPSVQAAAGLVVDHRVQELSWFENLNFWFTRRDGAVFQAQHLSYGQKRLLAFLYYLDCNPSFVIADELVNGFHHAWIEECMKAIGDRQAFLTSQNPLLLDYLYFDNVDQVKESFILCRTEADGDRDRMIWRNMTDDEAAMFYEAYKVGLQYVGEILRTRGLW